MFFSLKNNIKKYFLKQDAKPLFIKNNLEKNFIDFNLCRFGKKNKNKVFYVIRRSPGAGMFSNFIFVLNHLLIAEKNKFIPVVDMQNFTTIYNEKSKINNSYNAWEYYFDQTSNYSLKEVYQSQNVVISSNKFYKSFSNIIANKKFRNIATKYIRIKKKYILLSKNYYQKYLNNKTLAVHYRGTSYKTSAGHPFPATYDQTINYIKLLFKDKKYNKIFLCTEDLNFFDKMEKTFKKNLYYIPSFRSKKDNAFVLYPRKNHRYNLGKEILIESLIINQCKGFLHAKTNVSEFVKFLDHKNKIYYFELYNGKNTSNEYLAPYLWYYKNLLPEFLGGFKNKL